MQLLGTPTVRTGSSQVALRPSELHLLAFLLIHHGKRVPRDAVAATLWRDGGDSACRRRLSTTLWRLRARIDGDVPVRHSVVGNDNYGNLFIDDTAVAFDVALFETDVEGVPPTDSELQPHEAKRLQRAIGRYRGDLLEGLYDEWVLTERERLLGLYQSTLLRLMRWHQRRGESEPAISLARSILDRDPLREDIHRALIRCYAQMGARPQALDAYQRCRSLLRDELGIDPLPETTAAAMAVVRNESPAPPTAPMTTSDLLNPLLQMRDQVEALRSVVDSAIAQLRATGG